MFRAILLQAGATVVATVAGGVLAGVNGAISAASGGLICLLPNLLFALRLKAVSGRPGVSFLISFLLGEIVKLAVIVGLLFAVAKEFPGLHWPSALIGLVLATQALFFAFWKKN